MRIGEMARRVGIPPSTLRYYESEGLIPKPARVGGKRVYTQSVLDNLRIIGVAKAAGFTVLEIRHLLRGFSRKTPPSIRWRVLAEKKLGEVDERMAQLLQMKLVLDTVLKCECPSFDDCVQALKRRYRETMPWPRIREARHGYWRWRSERASDSANSRARSHARIGELVA